MTSDEAIRQTYPSPVAPTRSVAIAAEYLVSVVEKDLGTMNGGTALYWHLIHVIHQHAGRPAADLPRGTDCA
jgi:hypothetical protein